MSDLSDALARVTMDNMTDRIQYLTKENNTLTGYVKDLERRNQKLRDTLARTRVQLDECEEALKELT